MEMQQENFGADKEDNDYYDEEDDDSSDDDIGLLKPAFDLQALKVEEEKIQRENDRNPARRSTTDGPPTDGLEYLLQVRREAKHIPNVVVARSISFSSTIVETPSVIVDRRNVGSTQKAQLDSFASARKLVLDARCNNLTITTSSVNVDDDMEVENNSDDDLSANEPNNSESFFDRLDIENKQPLITTMLSFDQYDLADLIDEFAEKLVDFFESCTKEETLSYSRYNIHDNAWPLGRWIFSSLAAVDEPASAEALAAMRNLAKTCMNAERALKDKLSGNSAATSNVVSITESILVDLELFLLIVVIHFKQSDLVDIVME